jgi:UDP-glucose 4-epimerase
VTTWVDAQRAVGQPAACRLPPAACRFDFHGPTMHIASIGTPGDAFNPRTFIAGSRPLEGKDCLVLGAGGFIGKALCERLCENGARVRALVRRSPPTLPSRLPVTWTKGDFTDRSTLSNIVRGQDFIFHLAYDTIPETSNRNPTADLLANVRPTLNLLDLCCTEGVGKVIFASSGGTVYGVTQPESVINENAPTNPISAYGVTKLTIEKYLALYKHLHNLDYQVLRISNPYGPGQSPHKRQGLVATILHRALTRQTLEIWGDGEIVRDYLHIRDVTRAFLYASQYKGDFRIMNVGSGVGLSVNCVLKDIEVALGDTVISRRYVPGRVGDVPRNVLDIALIASETGWRPEISWTEGLLETASWMREQLTNDADRSLQLSA